MSLHREENSGGAKSSHIEPVHSDGYTFTGHEPSRALSRGEIRRGGEFRLRTGVEKREDHTAIAAPGPFKVSAFMPSMDHGTSPTQVQPLLDERGQPVVGGFVTSKIFFTMRGEWEIRVSVRYADGKEETQKFLVQL